MNKLRALISEHKKASVLALFLLIVFVGSSAMSAVNVAQRRADEASSTQNEQSAPEQGSEQREPTQDVELTDSQREVINGYDDATRELIETLSASVWSASDGRCTLRFSDDSYVEAVNGESTVHSYAISRIDSASDGYGGTIDTIVFETDTGTHIVTYTDGKGSAAHGTGDGQKAASTVIASLTSESMFSQKGTPYERADAVENIAVKGLNSEVTQLIGGGTDSLASALSNWCAVNYPTATEATWNEVASIDWKSGTVTTGFVLDGDASTEVTVVYRMDDGTFDFGL